MPTSVTLPAGWTEGLQRCLDDLRRRGWVVLHEHVAPPVEPAIVMQALADHPDLDPELLQFYGVMDGLEIVVGRPEEGSDGSETVRRFADEVSRKGAPIGCLGELYSDARIGPALQREFPEDEDLRFLEIPSLVRLLDDSEDFAARDGKAVIYGAIGLHYGEYLGLTTADEIQRWRQPSRGSPGREGYYDHHADAYQDHLAERQRTHPQRWWVVRGEDHGACLWEPPVLLTWGEMLGVCLLTWGEMLGVCLQHLRDGE
jgi:hypothetical protein